MINGRVGWRFELSRSRHRVEIVLARARIAGGFDVNVAITSPGAQRRVGARLEWEAEHPVEYGLSSPEVL